MTSRNKTIIRFDNNEIDLNTGEFRRDGTVLPVEPQVLDLIVYLASRPGELVSRDDVIEAVWHGRIVSESAIGSRINAARAALGDDGKTQRMIKTVPRRGFRLMPKTYSEPRDPEQEFSLPDKPSIAILPFENMSADPDQEYFSDGITDDIITELARYNEIFVIARNSSFAYKEGGVDVRTIAAELGVRTILEGSVRRAADSVRITAQLVEAATGSHIWADRFDRKFEDIFAVQDEISTVIVNTLVGKLVANHVRLIPAAIDAYDHALRGMVLFQRIDSGDNIKARLEAERAIAIDPEFARAHALKSWTHALDGALRWNDNQPQSFEQAHSAAIKAVALDDQEPWAHSALGYSEMFGRKAHRSSIAAFERSVALNPNSAHFRSWYAMALCYSGEAEAGLREIGVAMRQNPHYPPAYLNLHARILFTLRRFQDALIPIERGIAAMPWNPSIRLLAAASYVALDRLDDAKAAMKEALVVKPGYRMDEVHFSAPYSKEEDLLFYLDLLTKAGMPR